ncbi:MAG: GNAT family N-acetyltransferase [Ectothiorhodospiraceae bacterium]|nr:GNAT family N-acetyltransferase [Ectothiorhodospiraceae bacterium]
MIRSDSVRKTPFVLRPPVPGDIGWVIYRHGALYHQEYQWDDRFELLVADIAVQFLRSSDPQCERCWIAEMDGENVGCVFLMKASADVAKLRLLLVEPTARGLGIGKCLVQECITFARLKHYQKLVLWTNDVLVAARRIYADAGFVRLDRHVHQSFGQELVGEHWELTLA